MKRINMEKKLKMIGLSMEVEMHKELKKLAVDYGISLKDICIQALREFLVKHKNGEKKEE